MEKSKLNINPQHVVAVDIIDSQQCDKYQWLIDQRSSFGRMWQGLFHKGLEKDQSGFYHVDKHKIKLSKSDVLQLEKDHKFHIIDFKVFLRPRIELFMSNGSKVVLYYETLLEAENALVRFREQFGLNRLTSKDEFTAIKSIDFIQ